MGLENPIFQEEENVVAFQIEVNSFSFAHVELDDC
jgi:hypothetical protein